MAEVACVLRNTGEGWCFLDDGAHVPIGVKSVTQTGSSITLWFNFTATQIHTFVVTPDETYATQDQIICGASVGYDKAVIQMSRAGTPGAVNPSSLCKPSGNLWVYGRFSVACPSPEI